MTKHRKPPQGAKRKPISSSRGPQKTTKSLPPVTSRHSPGRWNWAIMVPIVVSFAIAAIPFGYGKYFEFNSPGAFDSGGYVYSAYRIVHGATMGVDEIPSAKVGTLLVNMLGVSIGGYSEAGPKTVQMVLQGAALILMFFTIRRVYGTLAGAVSITLAAIYLSSPAIAKFGNVKEQYMIAFMVMGMSCFILRQCGGRWFWTLLAGALVAWAPLFKETGVSVIAALGLFILVQPLLKHRTWKLTVQDIGLLFLGAVISVAPVMIWMKAIHTPMSLPYSFLWKYLSGPFSSAFESQDSQATASTPDPNARTKNKPPNKWNVPHFDELIQKTAPGQTKQGEGYVTGSRKLMNIKKQAPIVFRYYSILKLPIVMALGAILLRVGSLYFSYRRSRRKRKKPTASMDPSEAPKPLDYSRFVLLFAVWWLLDMAFIWISPRSYEQYYLPINASAVMLGGYLIGCYGYQLRSGTHGGLWWGIGAMAIVLMAALAWPVVFGLSHSPHSGQTYRNFRTGEPEKRRGYVQKYQEIQKNKEYLAERKRRLDLPPWSKNSLHTWQIVGDYIRDHSTKDDTIYVWGWYPGIYVRAQREAPTPRAFISEMHVWNSHDLAMQNVYLVDYFKKNPPKFIVDSRKDHFPWNRPPLELWPRLSTILKKYIPPHTTPEYAQPWLPQMVRWMNQENKKKKYAWFLPKNEDVIRFYNNAYMRMLEETIDAQEAVRFYAMYILREYIRENYHIVKPDLDWIDKNEIFWPHVLLERNMN